MFGGYFVAHQADGVCFRANEDKARLFDLFGEIGVFGKEAVAGVDGICIGNLGGGDNGGDIQIALCRGGGTDTHGFIGKFDVEAVFVGFGVDGNGGNAHFTAGPQHPQCDFAAVGD